VEMIRCAFCSSKFEDAISLKQLLILFQTKRQILQKAYLIKINNDQKVVADGVTCDQIGFALSWIGQILNEVFQQYASSGIFLK
jgi:hypothetical protein